MEWFRSLNISLLVVISGLTTVTSCASFDVLPVHMGEKMFSKSIKNKMAPFSPVQLNGKKITLIMGDDYVPQPIGAYWNDKQIVVNGIHSTYIMGAPGNVLFEKIGESLVNQKAEVVRFYHKKDRMSGFLIDVLALEIHHKKTESGNRYFYGNAKIRGSKFERGKMVKQKTAQVFARTDAKKDIFLALANRLTVKIITEIE